MDPPLFKCATEHLSARNYNILWPPLVMLTFSYRRGLVADPRGHRPRPPPWTKMFSISCSFYGKSGKFVCWPPSYEESWIRSWGSLLFDTPLLLSLFEFIYSAFNFVAGHLRCYVCKNCKGDLGSQQGQCLKCATVFQQGKLSFEIIVIESYQH